MAHVAAVSAGTGVLKADVWASTLMRILTAIAAWVLIGSNIIRPEYQFKGIRLILFVAVVIIAWAGKVRGARVFARTPIDVAFVAWLALAVMSQFYATLVLHRLLDQGDIEAYIKLIVTIWAVYRAAFALTMVDPRTGSGALIKATLFFLGAACVIGIVQAFGPPGMRSAAVNFASQFGAGSDVAANAMGASTPRAVALFSGPNVFGFANLIGMAAVIGLTVSRGKDIRPQVVWLSTSALFVFLVGAIAAQSRFAIVAGFALMIFYLFLMLRTGRKKVFLWTVIAVCAVAAGTVAVIQTVELNYIQRTLEKRLSDDSSFQVREAAFQEVVDRAGEIAVLGVGYDTRGYTLHRQGDIYARTNSTDNGYLQAFVNHGILGLLHLLFLFWSCYFGIQLAKGLPLAHIRSIRYFAILTLLAYVIYSVSGVRHAKLETAVYLVVVFGSIYGAVYGERFFGGRFARPIASQ